MANGIIARLDELQLQKTIRLIDLPLAGKIRGVYQSIVKKCVAPKAASCKHENPQGVGKSYGRHKKAR